MITNPAWCAVLPPHLLHAIARNGSPEQRERALRTLSVDSTRRTARAVATATSSRRPAPAGPAAPPGPRRTVSDAGHGTDLPGRAVRAEGAPQTGDPATDEAYDGLGATYQLYASAYGRDSVDGRGLPLLGSVHYSTDYDNAFWDGTQMVFGDGDGTLFLRFTRSVDVIGHELTHGVTQAEAALAYQGQSGALNESVSDVFGSLVKQQAGGQSAEQADWLIGAELLAPGVHGVALRSMSAPGTAYDDPVLGKDPQPATMAGYITTQEDDGGVHINSGIPNSAFHLAAVALGGRAWERAGRIWYDALLDPAVQPSTDFAAFAEITVQVAGRDPDAGGAAAVRDAWRQVGVLT